MKRRGRRSLLGMCLAIAASAAPTRVRAAEEAVSATASSPTQPVPIAATVAGQPTAVLGSPGTTTVQLALGGPLQGIAHYPGAPSGGVTIAVVATRRLELSLAGTGLPLDPTYGPLDARLGARFAMHDEGAWRVALLADLHGYRNRITYPTNALLAADAGIAVTLCGDQACRASATVFGTIDRHHVRDTPSDDTDFQFERSEASFGGSAAVPFNGWGSAFAGTRLSIPFARTAVLSNGYNRWNDDPLFTATAGVRAAARDGRLAFDLAASAVHGSIGSVHVVVETVAFFAGAMLTVAWDATAPTTATSTPSQWPAPTAPYRR